MFCYVLLYTSLYSHSFVFFMDYIYIHDDLFMMILNGIPIYTHPATLVFGALGFFMFHKRWWFLYSESSMSAGIPLPRLEKPPYVTPHPGQLRQLLVIFCAWKMMGKGWKRHEKAKNQWFFIVFMCFYHKFRELFPNKNWWLGAYRIFRHAHLVSWGNIPTDSGVLFLIEFESHWPHPYSDFRRHCLACDGLESNNHWMWVSSNPIENFSVNKNMVVECCWSVRILPASKISIDILGISKVIPRYPMAPK